MLLSKALHSQTAASLTIMLNNFVFQLLLLALLSLLFFSHPTNAVAQTEATDEQSAALENEATTDNVEVENTKLETVKNPVSPAGFQDPSLAKQIRRLPAGENDVSALYISQINGATHGGVLLIPNLMSPPSKIGIINSLRNALPQSHWHTLALDLRSIDSLNVEQIALAISAGVKFLNDEGIFNIAIIAEGVGAAQTIHYVSELSSNSDTNLQSVRALILIDAINAVPQSDIDTLEKLGEIKLPILDAYSANNGVYQQLAKERKSAHYRNGESSYRQITLPREVNYYQSHENHITKRIRGWMDKNISGFTVEQNPGLK